MHALNNLALVAMLALPAFQVSAQAAAPAPPTASTQSVTTALQALLPSGVTVQEMRQDGEVFIFSGASTNNAVLSDFMRRTMSSAGLRDVELREIAADGSQYRYEMSIKADCGAPGASRPGGACASLSKGQSVHKCRIDGVVTFQAAPCPAGTDA